MSELSVSRPGWRARAVTLRLRSDDRLARDAASGDAASFAALYERHHQPLYRYCRSLVGNPEDAADALQSTMTRAFASIAERNPSAPVRAWLFRIAHNESISLIRRRRTAEPLDAETLVGPDVAADAEHRRRLADLVRDLQGLTERQRGALLMREVSGLGHAEIAAALGSTEGAVKQSIYEARIALQELAMGREMSCSAVRRELSDGDGRTARTRRLRGHLRSCEDCRSFRDALRARRSELALIVPVLPAATAAAVLDAVIGAGGVGGGGLLAGLLGGGAAKAVAVGAATVTAGAGVVTYTAVVPDEERRARAAKTKTRDDAGKAEMRARKVPVVVKAVARPERDESVLVSRDRPRTEGDGRHGSPPSRERDDDAGGGGRSGTEGERDKRDEDEDEERRKPSSGERDDDSSGERDDGESADDEDDDSSGSGSSRRERDLAGDSSGSGKGEAELAEDSSGKGSGESDEDESGDVDEDDAEKD
jgi:RNA polymerase sigma factor (sigma-70 family)